MKAKPDAKASLQRLMTVDDLAAYLCKSAHTIRHDASRAAHRLPPRVRLPDSSLLRWQPEIVHAWVQTFQVDYKPKARKGRPRQPV